jgi:uncharacterized membrane protein YjjP (DUF1212 family)
MSDEQDSEQRGPGSQMHGEGPESTSRSLVRRGVVTRTSRFSAEVVATMISLASAAFGVVAALAWNTAITKAFEHWLGTESAPSIGVFFVYAVVVTLIGVIVIVFLGRLAARIKAQPLEFKYPGIPRS